MTNKLNFARLVPIFMAIYFTALMFSNAVIQMGSGLLILIFLVHLILNRKEKSYLFFTKIPKIALYPMVLFFLSGVASAFVNIEDLKVVADVVGDYRWLIGYLSLSYLLFIFFKKEWIQKSHFLYIVAILESLLGIHQALTGVEILQQKHFRLIEVGGMYRSIGTFSISLTFAYVYGMLFFGLFPQILMLKKNFSNQRLVFLSLVCSCLLLSVVLSQTRGAWLAFAVSLFLFFVLYQPMRKYLLLLLVVLPSFYFFGPSHLKNRITSMANITTDESNTGRFVIWKGHYNLFKKDIFFGMGMKNNVKLLQASYDELGIVKGKIDHAHNSYIHMLSAQGLLGFIPFLIMHIAFLYLALLLFKSSDPITSCLGMSAFLLQIFINVGGLTEATFIDQELNHQLIFCWALVTALFVRDREKADLVHQPQ